LQGAYVKWRPSLLFKILSMPEAKGILFFDEMNLAVPSVQAAGYQIFLDNCIGETPINKGVYVIGAGNRAEDRANVFEMAGPLKNRFCHYTLAIPTTQAWIEYAMNKELDDRILAFLQFRPAHLMQDLAKLADRKSNAFPTPRSWEFTSDLIKGIPTKEREMLRQLTAACVGFGISHEFEDFLALQGQVDIDDLLKNPEKARDLPINLSWCLMQALSERYRGNRKTLGPILDLSACMRPDCSVSLLRMLIRQNTTGFKKAVQGNPKYQDILTSYAKYLT